MPVKSKAQKHLMEAVKHGWEGGPPSLSKSEATKFLADSPKGKRLPARVKKGK